MAEGSRSHEARLLARLRLARLHPRAARLDGEGRAAARPRAGRARPRQLLRRRRDRRAQPGARRHAQRAHVRDGPGGRGRGGHDEHLLDLPGRAVGVPGAPRRRRRLPRRGQRAPRSPRASPTSAGGDWWNKNFLWILVEEIGLDTLREQVERPLEGLRIAPFYGCYIVRPTKRLGFDEHPERDQYLDQVIEALGARAGRVRGRAQVLRLPGDHDEPHHLAAPGRPPPGRRDRRRRRLPGHALPALPPQPGPAAAGGRRSSWSATSACPCCTCRRWSGLALGLEPKELGMGKHVVSTREVQRKVAQLAAA